MKTPSDYQKSTIAYYDQNASEFCANTTALDMSALYEPFLRAVPAGGRILDAGCGSGRGSLAFLKLGYTVVSVDASLEMVRATTAYGPKTRSASPQGHPVDAGLCETSELEPASAPETPRIKQEAPKSWTRRRPSAYQPFITDASMAAVTTRLAQAASR